MMGAKPTLDRAKPEAGEAALRQEASLSPGVVPGRPPCLPAVPSWASPLTSWKGLVFSSVKWKEDLSSRSCETESKEGK